MDDILLFRRMMLAVIVDWLFISLNIRAFSKIISSKFCLPSMLHSMLVGHRVHCKEIHQKDRGGVEESSKVTVGS